MEHNSQKQPVQMASVVRDTIQIMASGTEPGYPQKSDPLFFRQKVYEICPQFKLTENNKETLNEIYNYVHGESKMDPKKGILFFGPVGTGKSTMMKILAEYQRLFGRGFMCVNTSLLAAQFATHGVDALNQSTWNDLYGPPKPVERGFDELGRETIPAKHYGNELNVMEHIFQIRYGLKVKTHATTNMHPDDIAQKYGNHIFDRCFEMFNFVELKGDSFRL